jgi:hypothetical protein
MTDYVRVREGAWEYSPQRHQIADPEAVEFLDKPATHPSGRPLEPKPVTPLGTPGAGSKQERRRATKKTAAKKAAAPKTPEADSPGKDAGQTSATPETEN